MYVAQERLYRTRDDRIVPEGDPDAAELFVRKGGTVPFQLVARYGLTSPSTEAERQAPAAPPATTARLTPPATTARAGPRERGRR